jgi:hypothetical protein
VQEQLSVILATMDVPALRRDLTSLANLGWLNRNLAIRNSSHPRFGEAIEIIRRLLVDRRKTTGKG